MKYLGSLKFKPKVNLKQLSLNLNNNMINFFVCILMEVNRSKIL